MNHSFARFFQPNPLAEDRHHLHAALALARLRQGGLPTDALAACDGGAWIGADARGSS